MTCMKRIVYAPALGVMMLVGSSLCAPPVLASYVATVVQEGSDVVATGSGTLNLASLTIIPGTFTTQASVQPNIGLLFLGEPMEEFISSYTGVSGPSSFGNGNSDIFADAGSGGIVGVDETTPLGMRVITVPGGYVSGTALSETSTWTNQTFSSLGLTPGTYIWTWGSGASADSFTLDVAPEPSTLLLVGVALGAIFFGRAAARDAASG
jgi:hypothetical protein